MILMVTQEYLTVDRDLFKEELRNDVYEVCFRKVDGSTRTINATLDPSWMPTMTEEYKDSSKKYINPNVLAVWDIDLKEWRSFRLDHILSIEPYSELEVTEA